VLDAEPVDRWRGGQYWFAELGGGGGGWESKGIVGFVAWSGAHPCGGRPWGVGPRFLIGETVAKINSLISEKQLYFTGANRPAVSLFGNRTRDDREAISCRQIRVEKAAGREDEQRTSLGSFPVSHFGSYFAQIRSWVFVG